MPRLSRYFIRASLIYLLLGLTAGALILTNKGIPFAPLVWVLLPLHIETMFVGWMSQLALGVAFWILPRLAGDAPRGNERWSWAALVLINLGLIVAMAAPFSQWPWPSTLARSLEAVGFIAFVLGNWRRIYSPTFGLQTLRRNQG
ncbi:MAG TPA: hypothetical protein DEF43_16185 [Chloroflexus aurantiacus]|jgi:hypothetical protein|uniref:Uncharacterized protein n=1 Tax=Chloroflexus aurantiacus (strain ATCC 29366 / DSM 635 / J-10-fl) TaxID=324602 RepID=A9WE14_CHLAA|nr:MULTISPECIES: cbb3-type cytochrome c oxidase subunit I [Chloroflexus]ABY35173.1 conserved hypothetical protein [Chloroflexus aurantiacus J-10-fl]RMG52373.1 MAG: hypothetical protein D6716_03750 [Chloroflexota bacterium]GIV92428.1 MAG: hypothetical protein KatS3mg056_1137 [Chloroflexus sp.]HBW68654.1 hypothetical protein [Chloroflexus aurantiacus]